MQMKRAVIIWGIITVIFVAIIFGISTARKNIAERDLKNDMVMMMQQSSTEEKEDINSSLPETAEEWEEIKYKEYGEDGEEISFHLSQNSEGELKLNIVGTVDENWKAAYIFTIYATIIADDNIKETLNPILIMMTDDVMLSTVLSYKTNGESSEIIDTVDWITENITDGYDEDEAKELKDKTQNYFVDFLELE